MPPLPSDGDRRDGEVAPVVPTAAEAAEFLQRYAITVEPCDVGVAIAVLLDHIVRCEQALTLVRSGHERAMRRAPDHAVIDVGRTKG